MTQYGRIPWELAENGGLASMKPSDLRVYYVLCMHVGPECTCRVGNRRIRKLSGLTGRVVSLAIRRLAEMGAIHIRSRGPGLAHEYTISGLAALQTHVGRRPASETRGALQMKRQAPCGRRAKQKNNKEHAAGAGPACDGAGRLAAEDDIHRQRLDDRHRLADMSPDQIETCRMIAIERCPQRAASWRHADPASNLWLRSEILRAYDELNPAARKAG